jgi:glycosyltransferase involved in cell wall biosynthesis
MPSFHEGMSNSVLEAMACALPVVATAVSGNSDLVSHGRSGLLVPPDDPAALAAAIDGLLHDPVRARELGAYGRTIAETRYRFDTMVDRCCELYRRADI